jgi:hypothetical protein
MNVPNKFDVAAMLGFYFYMLQLNNHHLKQEAGNQCVFRRS